MGTRAITHVVNDEGEVYVSLYRQFDGYPNGGHGEDLADFLEGAVIGNGIRMDESRGNFFNGVGDLAARLVAFFKKDPGDCGGFYLYPPDISHDEEFTYIVRAESGYSQEGGVTIEVINWGKTLFNGTSDEFASWVKASEW
jgi:hypothetical protein